MPTRQHNEVHPGEFEMHTRASSRLIGHRIRERETNIPCRSSSVWGYGIGRRLSRSGFHWDRFGRAMR